jgi:hypothetical protein
VDLGGRRIYSVLYIRYVLYLVFYLPGSDKRDEGDKMTIIDFTQEAVIGIKLVFKDKKKFSKFERWIKIAELYSYNQRDMTVRITCDILMAEIIKKRWYKKSRQRN